MRGAREADAACRLLSTAHDKIEGFRGRLDVLFEAGVGEKATLSDEETRRLLLWASNYTTVLELIERDVNRIRGHADYLGSGPDLGDSEEQKAKELTLATRTAARSRRRPPRSISRDGVA